MHTDSATYNKLVGAFLFKLQLSENVIILLPSPPSVRYASACDL